MKEDNILTCRFHFKNGFYTEIIKDHVKAGQIYAQAYDSLLSLKS